MKQLDINLAERDLTGVVDGRQFSAFDFFAGEFIRMLHGNSFHPVVMSVSARRCST